jgi:energy-coupling factor transporter ATP-binding protein EcfA2
VLITHELEVVKTLCDHAALLEQGEIIESGKLPTCWWPHGRGCASRCCTIRRLNRIFSLATVSGEAIMRSSMSWEDLWPLLLDGTLDTFIWSAWRPCLPC